MFTKRQISLSALADVLALDVRRDAEIAYVGKVPTPLEARLVPVSQPAHLEAALALSGIAAVVAPAELVDAVPAHLGCVVSDAPLVQAMAIHEHLCALPGFLWEDFTSRIDPTAHVAPGAHVAAQNVVIGPGCEIAPGAVICERVVLGAQCQIGPGTVVGSDAFEQTPGASPKRILKQAGGVWLEDHVTIQAKGTVVRATFGGFTRVGRETKADAQVHIAHDCQIAERVTITACSEISGRVEIGADAYLGPNCAISNGVRIGAGAVVTIGSVVVRDVPDGARVTGNFALPHEKWLNFIRKFR